MRGDRIPDQDNVARMCKHSDFDKGQIQAPAFFLKSGDNSLSVNWLEFLNCQGRESELVELRRIYSTKLKVRRSHKIAVLNVGEIREKVQEGTKYERNVEILHDPIENEKDPSHNDPSHSGIYGLEPDDELIAELIIETNPEIYPARI